MSSIYYDNNGEVVVIDEQLESEIKKHQVQIIFYKGTFGMLRDLNPEQKSEIIDAIISDRIDGVETNIKDELAKAIYNKIKFDFNILDDKYIERAIKTNKAIL